MSEELPRGWTSATLRELAWDSGYGTSEKCSYDAVGIPVLRIPNVARGKVDLSDLKFARETVTVKSGEELRPGDLLVVRTNGSKSLVGQAALIEGELARPHLFASYLIRFRLIGPGDLHRWAAAWMRGVRVRMHIESKAASSAGQHNISLRELGEISLPLPPLAEQRRIVAKIEDLTARSRRAREALAAIPALIEKFKQSVLAAAFRGELTADWREKNPDVEPANKLLKRIKTERRRKWEQGELAKMRASGKAPKDERWKEKYKDWTPSGTRHSAASSGAGQVATDDLPPGWTHAALGEIVSFQAGYAFKTNWYSDSGIRLLRGTNIVPGGTRWDDVALLPESRKREFEEYELREGDVVLAMDRPIISSGIKVARLSGADVPSLLLQRVGRFQQSTFLDAGLLFWFVQSQRFIRHTVRQATGTQLPHISVTDVETTPLWLPPLDEQVAIRKSIDEAMGSIQALAREMTLTAQLLAALDQSILAKAFRGELVPQDPNDEPASVMLKRLEIATPVGRKARRASRSRGKI